MGKIKPDNTNKQIPELEDEVTKFWKKNNTFEKSIEMRSEDNQYSFLDGPPFVTGIPGYHSLLPRIAKDVIPRYQTMLGKRVRRVWGWDCHGLPIEEKTEKKIGLKNRRDIEKYGINKFLDECRTYVEETSSEWGWYVDKIGEWVDLDNAYRTMDTPYMESVIWTFKQLYDKGMVYEGVKTLLYCTRCGTPVSRFEISMDDSYAEMEDPSVVAEFEVTTKCRFNGDYLLAWTTTPWTLPSNRALVIDEDEVYVRFESEAPGNYYVAAKKRLEFVLGKDKHKIVEEFKGSELIGLEYKPLFDYFPPNKNDFKVYAYEGMVTMDEGTGIVHSAPGFGEVDTEMGQANSLTLMFSVDDEGKFVPAVKDYAGVYVKKADKKIIEDLKKKDVLFWAKKIKHRAPYCYRCETPLIQRAQKGWFVNIQDHKKKLLEINKKINWVPDKLRKRFVHTIETAPDWNISRTRYWATIIPIWRCVKCNETEAFGSIKEIEERSGKSVKNLHRSGVDHITFDCKKCKAQMKRIPEVLDVWFESGAMPYGQVHYPFENKELFSKTFPADYIIEYVGQIRAWFYYMHVLSNALAGEASFENVVVTGVMMGTDGRKMSKSFGNYPDPKTTLEKYGGDAIRLYLMGSPVMMGQDISFSEEDLRNKSRNVLNPLWNACKYLLIYADLNDWELKSIDSKDSRVLNKWLKVRLNRVIKEIAVALDAYDMPSAVKPIEEFSDELSNWFVRRSRDLISTGDEDTITALYITLMEFSKAAAPLVPFIAENIYRRLVVATDKSTPESVHLCDYPKYDEKLIKDNRSLLRDMKVVRKIASLGNALRKDVQIPIRQPLSVLEVSGAGKLSKDLLELIKDELNIKNIKLVNKISDGDNWKSNFEGSLKIAINTELSEELLVEGYSRELMREIQKLRKKADVKWDETVKITYPDEEKYQKAVKKYKKEIKEKTLATSLETGSEFKLI